MSQRVIQDSPEGTTSCWNLQKDAQVMKWATSRPEDWQLGGLCEAFLWGGGRHGQMGEIGRSVLTPLLAASFSCAQQVSSCPSFHLSIFPLN